MVEKSLIAELTRIADALERLAPIAETPVDLNSADAFLWDGKTKRVLAVKEVRHVPLGLLQGIDATRDRLLSNTRQFVRGGHANNALLWGARGMGKSSLVKAIHAEINRQKPHALGIIEIAREDIETLPALLTILTASARQFILFCDDMSFDGDDSSYKSLKAVLDGGIAGRPANVLFYATSNRRHLMPRDMMENERATAIHPGEAVEEKVSLSDRFGLWLGFYSCDQATYLAIIDGYARAFNLESASTLHTDALEWSKTRGSRSGRVAWQFIQDICGRQE